MYTRSILARFGLLIAALAISAPLGLVRVFGPSWG